MYTQNVHKSSTRSHASEEENPTRKRSKNCVSKRALLLPEHIRPGLDAVLFMSRT